MIEFNHIWFLGTLSNILVSFLGVTTLIVSATRYQRVRTKRKLEKNTIKHKLTELKVLRAQIKPHFLFNTINSIQAYILEDKHSVAENYLVKYSQLMRNILKHSNTLTVSLADELGALNLYVDLEQVRVKQGFDFVIKVDKQIDQFVTIVPSMVIQPFIENAIWHGVSKRKTRGKITIEFISRIDEIEVQIRDNGVGFDSTSREIDQKSSAVRLARERLELLDESSGKESVIEINSVVGKGTTATIHFSNELSNSHRS